MTKVDLLNSPILTGISGGIVGYFIVNFSCWSFSMGILFYEMVWAFIPLIIVPFVLGTISGYVCQKTQNGKWLAFWIAFSATLLAMPIGLILDGTKISNFLATQFNQIPSLIFIQLIIGILIEMLLFSTNGMIKVLKGKIQAQ